MKEFSIAEYWYIFLIMGIVSYLVGCFNFAILISRIKHRDIRTIGSGNPGTMNMFREFGYGIGILNFFLDAFKGAIPAAISYFIFRDYIFSGTNIIVSDFTRYFCGFMVIVGHIFPVTLKFKGGKGIASTLGLFWVCLTLETWWFVFIGLVFLFFIALYIVKVHWGSMGSLMGVTTFTVWQGVIFFIRYQAELTHPIVITLFMFLLLFNLFTWVAHRKNIVRLVTGEEHLTGGKKKSKENV